mmetsp:Transcript_8606/g.10335  ORF Transcript_8606/g.10335 Transcript_8606/m.10335 type:complete len:372 (-) Transcript_8606:120-1235(-)
MLRSQALVEFNQDLKILERPLPVPKGPEVLIKTTFGGLCHSDVHLYEGHFNLGRDMKLPVPIKLPIALGHEIEGTVVAVGEDVPKDAFVDGKSYAIFPWIGCGKSSCSNCVSDCEHWCTSPDKKKFADGESGDSLYGGYSSHNLIPHWKYLLDYEGAVPKGLGCAYMCSGLTAYSALLKVKDLGINAEDVLILGLGGLGFQAVGMAKAVLGGMPLVADIDENKLKEAEKRGCRAYNTTDKKAVAKIMKESNDGTGIKAVIDFVGAGKTVTFGDAILRKGGKLVVVGLFGGTFAQPTIFFPLKARCIEGSFVGSLEETKDMLQLLRNNRDSVEFPPHHFVSIFEASKSLKELQAGQIFGRRIFKHDWPTSRN